MSYTTGTVNNYEDLLAALRAAAVAAGWTLSGSILSKGSAYIAHTIFTTETSTQGPGITLTGGTGVSAGALTGVATPAPRLGRVHTSDAPTWPATYHIFTFEDPAEIYCVLNYNVEFFHWLAWGVSDVPGLPGSGLWIGGSGTRGLLLSNSLGVGAAYSYAGLFFSVFSNYAVATGLDSSAWASSSNCSADTYAAPHIARTPSAWNAAAPLLPIQVWINRPSSKRSMVLDVRNARYIRIDNITPGAISTLGTEQWMVFPWFSKSTSISSGNHSGPHGWAIRYA